MDKDLEFFSAVSEILTDQGFWTFSLFEHGLLDHHYYKCLRAMPEFSFTMIRNQNFKKIGHCEEVIIAQLSTYTDNHTSLSTHNFVIITPTNITYNQLIISPVDDTVIDSHIHTKPISGNTKKRLFEQMPIFMRTPKRPRKTT